MYFKFSLFHCLKTRASFSFLYLFLLILFSACFPKIGEKPQEVTPQSISGLGCVEESASILKKFFQGNSSDQEISSGWDCFGSAFEKFVKYAQGSEKNKYSSQDLSSFLENNIFTLGPDGKPNKRIHPELQVELMKIKKIFVGGDIQYVTKGEIQRAIQIFSELKRISLNVNPYMKLFAQKWAPKDSSYSANTDFFERANRALLLAAKDLSVIITPNYPSYRLSDVIMFLNEYSRFSKDTWPIIYDIHKYLPLVKKIKKSFVGGAEEFINDSEWKPSGLLGASSYIQYLRYFYFLKPTTEHIYQLDTAAFHRLLEDSFAMFSEVLDTRDAKYGNSIMLKDIEDVAQVAQTLWSNFKVSHGFLIELMKLKRVFLGGNLDRFVSLDFQKARAKSKHIGVAIDRLTPTLKILSLEWNTGLFSPEGARKIFQVSESTLLASLEILAAQMEGTYDLNDILKLLKEYEFLYPPEKSENSIALQLEKFMPLIIDSKKILFEDGVSIIDSPVGWNRFLCFLSRIYYNYLFYYYFSTNLGIDSEPQINQTQEFISQVKLSLDSLLDLKPSGLIFDSELIRILQHAQKLNWLTNDIQLATMKNLIKSLRKRVFTQPKDRIAGNIPEAIGKEALNLLKYETEIFLNGLKFLLSKEGTNPSQLMASIDKQLKDKSISQDLLDSLIELRRGINSELVINIDVDFRIHIQPGYLFTFTKENLKHLNLLRTMARFITRAYPEDLSRVETFQGANLDEINKFYSEIREVFFDLGLLDSNNPNFASARFMEANIFTPRANGDELMNFEESFDEVALLISGSKINSLFEPLLFSNCKASPLVPAASGKVDLRCFRQSFLTHMGTLVSNLPNLNYYRQIVSEKEMNCYMYNIARAVGYIPSSDYMFNMSDASLFPHLLQYVESIYFRFDLNNDSKIDHIEAQQAFPVFKGLFRKLAKKELENGDLKEKDLYPLFTFILKKGKAPSSAWSKWEFILWRETMPEEWGLEVKRLDLSFVLAFIAEKNGNTNSTDLSPESFQEQIQSECKL